LTVTPTERAPQRSRTSVCDLEDRHAVRCTSRAQVPRRGFEPRPDSLKGSDAIRYTSEASAGRDLNPHLSPYKSVALTVAPPASWPPRSRTAHYRFIRAAPSTGWVVASRWQRPRSPSMRGEQRARSAARIRPAVFETAPAPRRVCSPKRTGHSKPAELPATRIPAGASTLAGSSSMRRAGDSNAAG
jgi:hypothetical protein